MYESDLSKQIDKYLESRRLAWAGTTLKSERHRLNAARPHLDGNPATLWAALERHGAYGRLTIWTRVSDFWQWMQDTGLVTTNPYRAFKKTNARQFKYVYTPKKPQISYEEAKARIATIVNPAIRRRALELLGAGLRYSESASVSPDGTVVGKGSKPRRVYLPEVEGKAFEGCYQTFRRALARVGIKPHDLRKLFLTRLVELGINEYELCEVAGWSSINTASSYIKANSERTKRLVQQAQGGTPDATQEPLS